MTNTRHACWSLAACALLTVAPAHALYKVVGPNGQVTYTDRPPQGGEKAAPVGAGGAAAPSGPALPLELRQAASRYPVTLYVVAGDCGPCDAGRQLLRQRGIPYSERQIVTTTDSEALQRLTGANETPVLTIGSQVMRGYSQELWTQYLDAAGYPKESRLPVGYQPPAPTPLTERRPAAGTPAAAARPSAAPAPAPAPAPASAPAGIQF